jgi:uncharacterized membrane protein YbhN (UPF0104 family)
MPSLRRRLIAGLVFGFLVALGVAFLGDIRQVTAHLASFAWGLLPLILACTLFNYLLRFVKWHLYLREIGAHTVGWAESARLFVAGFPLAVTPGKIGEALKGVWVNQRTGIPTARAIPVVLAERISDGLAVLILSTFGVVAYPAYWPAFAAVLGWLEGLPILRRGISHLRAFYEGAYVLFRPRITFLAVGLGTVAWLGEGVAMYLVLRGLGVTPGWQTFTLSVFTLSFSTVVGAVSALPGGLGAAEAGIAGMLGLVMGLPGETAAAATLLIRFATLWFGVSLGLIVWSFSRGLLSNSTSAGPPQTGT